MTNTSNIFDLAYKYIENIRFIKRNENVKLSPVINQIPEHFLLSAFTPTLVRIIGGKYKGKNIIAPKNLPVRPTTDFAKESLFNILNNQIDFEDCKLLELFAGTGNIGYEFASRGCEDITYRCEFSMYTIHQTHE